MRCEEFKDDQCTIRMWLGDCMDGMKDKPENHWDLSICDPPYGIGASEMNMGLGNKQWNKGKKWDTEVPNEEYFNELFRVSKNHIVWGGNYFDLPNSRGWIFWDKDVRPSLSFSAGELAWSSFDTVLKKAPIEYSGFRGAMGKKIHPTQKPVALYKWLLKNYATEGDKILDTHGGSGSIAIACYDMGFDLDWYELDTDYYGAAVDRFNKHKQQGQLFRPKQKQEAVQTKIEL